MGKKLVVYLIDGTEYGPRSAEIGNWSGKAIYSKRASIGKIIDREEFNNPGIYCLKGTPKNSSFTESVYVGESENIKARLKQHLADSKRDFSELIFFISKDELLTKAHIKYLESRIIQQGKEAKNAEIENSTIPTIPTLHEADISDMELYLDQMKLILPLMGFSFLVSTVISGLTADEDTELIRVYYTIKSKTLKARMYETPQGFVVEKGSQANKSLTKSIKDTYVKLREKLIRTGSLAEESISFVFTADTIFPSLSAASNIVLGRQSPGPIQWLNSEGITYKDAEENRMREDEET